MMDSLKDQHHHHRQEREDDDDDVDKLKQVFEMLGDGTTAQATIPTAQIVNSIQLDSRVLYDCFDPTDRGCVSFEEFLSGIEQLKQYQVDTTTFQSVDDHSNSFDVSPIDLRVAEDHHNNAELTPSSSSLSSLLLSPSSSSSLELDSNHHHHHQEQKSSNLYGFEDNMSMLDNSNKVNNFQFSQTEECFEFTPSNEESDKPDTSVDDTDELNSSGADLSYHSLKSTFNQRNTWLRSSVRRSGSSLQRNSSLGPYTSSPYKNNNTSGSPSNTNTTNGGGENRRNSISYESDEMNNDTTSLEDVYDKVNKLQNQIELLLEGQSEHERNYSAVKKENSNLLSKIHLLEEQIRDIEVHSEVKREEDDRRLQESMAKLDREKAQELQNYVNQILSLQEELFKAKEESRRQQETIDRLQRNMEELQENLRDKQAEVETLNEAIAKQKDLNRRQEVDCNSKTKLIYELNQELVMARQVRVSEHDEVDNQRRQANKQSILNHSEYEEQLKMLKQENRALKEANEELKEEMLNNHLMEGKSLLREGEAVSSLANEINDLNIEQLKTTLKEQQDVNAKLRSYIDGILLNIVENYPQLLEVKGNI